MTALSAGNVHEDEDDDGTNGSPVPTAEEVHRIIATARVELIDSG